MNRIISRRSAIAALATVAVVAATAGPAGAHLVEGNLPGGTSIAVSIDSPADGSVLPPGPVTITGTASVAMAEPVALIYVLDISGSTVNPMFDGCGGDQNNDGDPDQVLDCEILAARTLNDLAVDSGAVSEVGGVIFADGAEAVDVDPAPGDQLTTGPADDLDSSGVRDIEQVFLTARSNLNVADAFVTDFSMKAVNAGATDFAAAITEVTEVADVTSAPRTIVAFISDGESSGSGSIEGPLADVPDDVTIFTFAAGPDSDCFNAGTQGTLDRISQVTVGEPGLCTEVDDVASLPDEVPSVIASELNSLSLSVNGGSDTPITNVDPPLPQDGPASVEYTVTTGPLPAGEHELCVTAGGRDAGGQDDDAVTDCHTVIINAPPEVDAGGPYAGQEGSPVEIAGSVTDPDSPGVTSEWTISPGGDPGTTCEFGDPTLESTTVTCTDDGTFTLTLTADDGVNPPVSDTAMLELTNVAPAVDITAPDDGELFAAGTPVEFVAPFTDPGSNDIHTCTVDFDDGTPVAAGSVDQSPGSGTCTITHSFTELGPHQVLVTVTDDDGDSGTAVVTVVIFLPGEAFAIEANGLVTIPKTPHATCPPDESLTLAQLNAGIATVNALNADCTVDPDTGETVAAASVDQASLLGGVITISNIESTCQAGPDGITRSSSVGTINGIPIGLGSGSITIPLVAQVFYNETTTNAEGQLVQNAIRVQTLLGQQIILAGCRLG